MAIMEHHTRSHCKTSFHVILNGVKDLELINITRFFAALRMTNYGGFRFCNGL